MKPLARTSALLALATLALAACVPTVTTTEGPVVTDPAATAPAETTTDAAAADAFAPESYCEAANAGYLAYLEFLEHTDVKSAETGKEDNAGDIGLINSSGAAALVALNEAVRLWTIAQAKVPVGDESDIAGYTLEGSDPDVAEAYDAFFTSVDIYFRPEATISSEAASVQGYGVSVIGLLTQEGAAEQIGQGAVSLGRVLTYQQARCGVLPEPS